MGQEMMSFEGGSQVYSSFRDPAGHLYHKGDTLYRKINPEYFQQYRMLMSSGLYDELIGFKVLIPHEEVEKKDDGIIIRPELVPFISYPYEWTFGELKDAALTTLKIHRRAMRHGMILKDASAYNIQFVNGTATLIDTLSFDFYKDGDLWGAYGQFCRHFLAPLLLMVHKDICLNKLLSVFIDGIPLDLAASLLNGKGGLLSKMHIVWHAKSVGQHNEDGKRGPVKSLSISKKKHLALIEDLIRGIEKLTLSNVVTEWGDYYAHTNYSKNAQEEKERIVRDYIKTVNPRNTWDMGANDGTYSKLATEVGSHVVAFDIDPIAVERNYNEVKKNGISMLPLVLDMTNPSPGIGFANRERATLSERQTPDCVMALAVIHHMAISNNVPLPMLAEWFASLGGNLIIEFVPKGDSQVDLLLATRRDIFPDYNEAGFENAFSEFYELVSKMPVSGSKRTIYLWRKR